MSAPSLQWCFCTSVCSEGLCTVATRSAFERRLLWKTSVGPDTVRNISIFATTATRTLVYHSTALEADCVSKQFEGDMVLLVGESQPRNRGFLGRINGVLADRYGLVHQATVKTSTGQLLRSISRLSVVHRGERGSQWPTVRAFGTASNISCPLCFLMCVAVMWRRYSLRASIVHVSFFVFTQMM